MIARRSLVGGLMGVSVFFDFFLGHGRSALLAVAEVALMRARASISMMLLRAAVLLF